MSQQHFVIDARRVRDFGVGTYIRSLVHALGSIDTANRYTLVSSANDTRTLTGLPENFRTVAYGRSDQDPVDNLLFPAFLDSLRPNLVHIPLNSVPLLMMRPYVVTIHDMANLYFDQTKSGARMQLRRYRFRRGLVARAAGDCGFGDHQTRRGSVSGCAAGRARGKGVQRARSGVPHEQQHGGG